MSQAQNSAETVTGEGRDVSAAIEQAAVSLGVNSDRVGYKIDLTHFRSETGGVVCRDTVKIVAWELGESEAGSAIIPPPAEDRSEERSSRRSRDDDDRRGRRNDDDRRGRRDDDDRRGRRDDDDRRGRGRKSGRRDDSGRGRGRSGHGGGSSERAEYANLTETDASNAATVWFSRLLELMNIEGEVVGTGNDERVRLQVKADRAGRIIGKRGSTLAAIRHLLSLTLHEHGDLIVDVDVADDRQHDDSDRRRRDDRKRRQGDGDRAGRYAPEKLAAIGTRAAEKALETGRAITVNLQLNSYDRRLVHLAIADVDGVSSSSVVKDGVKFVQVGPASE